MNTIRLALSAGGLVLLAAGYAGSQLAFFQRDAPGYAATMDQPLIVYASLLLFLVAIGLAFVPTPTEGNDAT